MSSAPFELSPVLSDSSLSDDPHAFRRDALIGAMRQTKKLFPDARPDFKLSRPLEHGWLLKYLVPIESEAWGRWDYWADVVSNKRLPDASIPKISWVNSGDSLHHLGRKALEHALDNVSRTGHWHSWGTWSNFEYLLDWLLYGFGFHGQKTLPVEPSDAQGACERLYQSFNLAPLLLAPYDYFGDILAENAHGKHLGFFPTPMCVCQMMASMIMGDGDNRTKTVCDPCVGTGRMLLAASNHSLLLHGMDINGLVIKVTLVNGYLYAPWLVKPPAFLSELTTQYCTPELAPQVSEKMAEMAMTDPRAATYTDWLFTEHDFEKAPAVHPLKLRRPKKPASAQPDVAQAELELVC